MRYLGALYNLLPNTRFQWGRNVDTVLRVIAKELERVHDDAVMITSEVPGELGYKLEEWERITEANVGLASEDRGVRNNAVAAKLAAFEGQSEGDYRSLLERITTQYAIRKYTPVYVSEAMSQAVTNESGEVTAYLPRKMYDHKYLHVWEIYDLKREEIEYVRYEVGRRIQAHTYVIYREEEGQ